MPYAEISVAFVCLLSAGLCLFASARFLSRGDALRDQATGIEAAQVHLDTRLNTLTSMVQSLNTEHWENASARISGLTGRVADLEKENISAKESFKTFAAKIETREKRAEKSEKKEATPVPPELQEEDLDIEEMVRRGMAFPMGQQQPQSPVNGRRRFGERVG